MEIIYSTYIVLNVDISSFLYCCRHWALLKGAVTFISKVRLSWLCLDHKPKHIFHIFSKMNLIWYQKTCQTSDQKPNWPFIEKWRMREGIRKLVHFFSFIDFYCFWQINCTESVAGESEGKILKWINVCSLSIIPRTPFPL